MDAADSRPPACNQCRTRKIRCRREQPICSNCAKSGLACDFNTRSKRVNHTKQLVQDFSQLSGRLESIDNTLTKINQQLEQKSPSTVQSGFISARTDSTVDVWSQPLDFGHYLGLDRTREVRAAVTDPLIKLHTTREDEVEEYHGPTSLAVLMRHSYSALQDIISSRLATRTATNRPDMIHDTLRIIADAYPVITTASSVNNSHSTLVIPPKELIEAGVEAFLVNHNQHIPLFERSAILQSIERFYNGTHNMMKDAWTICFSSVALLGLESQYQESEAENDLPLQHLLSNSLHGLVHDTHLGSLAKLKAAVTSALVSADHCPNGTFEHAVRNACHIVREMGFEYDSNKQYGVNDTSKERSNVFWALYALDKQRAFLTGKACDLYLFDCGTSAPSSDTAESMTYVAKAQLMSIWEEIWTALYSAKASRCHDQDRAARVSRVEAKLNSWFEHYKHILEHIRSTQDYLTPIASLKLELQYCFHLGQLSIHRRGSSPYNLHFRRSSARAALRLFVNVAGKLSDPTHLDLIRRLCRYNSPLAFFDIHQRLLSTWDAASESDLDLLFRSYAAVKVLADRACQGSYHSVLATGMNWCLSVNKIICFAESCPIPHFMDVIPPEIPAGYQARESKRSATRVTDNRSQADQHTMPEQTGDLRTSSGSGMQADYENCSDGMMRNWLRSTLIVDTAQIESSMLSSTSGEAAFDMSLEWLTDLEP